ncbi:MAG TPA: glycosyltransferase family 4 protein [Hyphomicrobiaceae bacterium]|nr:glycosyltransferase family 4 protein [Hyphomicrobiaceae bacterium]
MTDVESNPVGSKSNRTVLFLAQMPPPLHGVTTMSKRVRGFMQDMPGVRVEHMWLGGARTLHDVGKSSIRKVAGFAWLLLRLAGRAISGRRYSMTYQTLAPHGEAAIRDALIIGVARWLSPRTLVHLHTQGLDEVLKGKSLSQKFIRYALCGTELIAISAHVGEAARRSGIFSAVHALPNYVPDPGRLTPEASPAIRCGYLGNLDPRKGVLRFVDVVSRMNADGIAVEGVIAGGPTKHLTTKDLQRYISQKGAGDFIKAPGFVSEAEKSRILHGLDFFIYPTDHDLAPLVVLEAMAHGAIPIVFDTGGLREMVGVEFQDHVIAEKGNPEVYAGKMVAIVRAISADPGRLARAKETARRHFELHYTEAVYRSRLASVVDSTPRPELSGVPGIPANA